ncbi:MAG TPA: hypothetical protein VGQ83_16705 [Polyangia bacterium]|jgi:hypothetical protein
MIPADQPTFKFARVSRPEDVPPEDPRVIDIALLDMNFGFPNLGHDSLVLSVGAFERELRPLLAAAGLAVRIVSYEVRNLAMVPELPGRFKLYLGTGGPGHIDPAQNDGRAPWAQGVHEDGDAWEPAAHRLFDAILATPDAAMLGVCHSFGVLCRWLGVARPTLRGPEKGGKSTGVQQNLLTAEGRGHPWFARFAAQLADGQRVSVMDSRLFDLIPTGALPAGMTAIAHEVLPSGARGDALTMLELARDAGGVMPRFLAMNHHPEIYDPGMQQQLVNERITAGHVSEEWRAERRRIIHSLRNPAIEWKIRLTARIALLDPLRFHLLRLVRLRHEQLAGASPVHEEEVIAAAVPGEVPRRPAW